jgi:actin-related protein
MAEDQAAVVIDNSSVWCKAGIARDIALKCCFPAIIGRPKMPEIIAGIKNNEAYVDAEA